MKQITNWVVARPRRIFVVSFAVFFFALAAWSLATPRFASPDEPIHVDKAAALYRGELIGTPTGGPKSAFTIVNIPDFYAAAGSWATCFIQKPAIPAGCATAVRWTSNLTPVRIYVGRYPPLYYAIVGLPSLLGPSWTTLYLMRLMSALASAILLALAVMSVAAWSRSRLLLLAIMVAATPSVLYFGGVVNPSGLEIAAAICLWSSGLVLVLSRPHEPPRGLVATVFAAAAVLVLVRGLSPLWLLLIAVALFLLGDARQLLQLLRRRDVQIGVIALGVCCVVAVAWILGAHSLDLPRISNAVPPGTTTGHIVAATFGITAGYIQAMIAEFGYLDTSAPMVTYYAWTVVVAFFFVIGILAATSRRIAVLLGLVVATVVIPVALSVPQTRHQGYGWQGRYTLPLAAGVVLASAAVADHAGALRRYPRRTAAVVLTALVVGQLAAFANTLRRYTVGLASTLDVFKGSWHPPLGDVVVLLWYLVAVLALAFFLFGLASRPISMVEAPAARDPLPGSLVVPDEGRSDVPVTAGD